MSELNRSINIRDVSREARVSVATVSRVLNDKGEMKKATREHVLAVIRRLGYRPNAQARRILRKRSEMVCFVLSNRSFMHPFHAAILEGVEARASTLKQHVVFVAVRYSEEAPSGQITLPPILTEKGWTDGVILAGIVYPNFLRRISSLDIPFVAFGNNVFGADEPRDFDQVCYDGLTGEVEATQYVISRGHRRIAFVGDATYPWFREQQNGYLRVMRANKLIPISVTTRLRMDFADYGDWASSNLLTRKSVPTAVLAGNDDIAWGMMRAFRRARVRVPDDISLVGFGDRELALHVDPPLTTVHVQQHELGEACMTLLMERLHNIDMPLTKRLLPTNLVLRGSVKDM